LCIVTLEVERIMSRRYALRTVMILIAFSAFILPAMAVSSCKMSPEAQRKVAEKTEVPGLEEALIAKDRAIAAAIQISLRSDPELAQNKFEIEVMNGKVILRGKVPTEELKMRAEKIARSTEGVKDVLNEIEVDPSLKEQRLFLEDL